MSLVGYISAGDSTACLGMTLFTLGEWRQLAPGGPEGSKRLFTPFLYPEDLFLGCFGLDLLQTLRRPPVMLIHSCAPCWYGAPRLKKHSQFFCSDFVPS